MKLTSFLKCISLVTMLSLAFIHMQMQIFDLAYEGKDKQKVIDQLVQQKEYLTYSIIALKSANNLGYEMLDEESDMQFVDPGDIMHISATEQLTEDSPVAETRLTSRKDDSIFKLLSFTSRAEARD